MDIEHQTPLQSAQDRLAKAAMQQPMTPNGAAISAYVNGIMASAKMGALLQMVIELFDDEAEATARFNALLVAALNAKAQVLEDTIANAPRVIANAAGGRH
jgi:hypothetical protein